MTEFARRREVAASERSLRFAHERLGHLAHEIRNSVYAVTLAFEALRRGNAEALGSGGALLGRSVVAMRNLVDRSFVDMQLSARVPQEAEPTAVSELVEESAIATDTDTAR